MTQNNDFEDLISIVSLRLSRLKDKNSGVLPEGKIEEILDKELQAESYSIDREKVLAELERSFATLIGTASSLHSSEKRDQPDAPWVASQHLQWLFWSRYRSFLLKKGWAEPVVSRLDQTTSDILDGLMSPETNGNWDQRGLVVGYVQSGKTANYIGLICKAVDAGYKVIVVLAGAHNNLRTQTQIRLEEGFLGYRTIDEDVNKREPIGVGRIHSINPPPYTITARGDNGDFKTAIAKNYSNDPGAHPLLFVVKKNTSILKNLYNWARDAAGIQGGKFIRNVPLLVIDDESDYASIDTKKQVYDDDGIPDPEHNPTTINRWIRLFLKTFEQSVYIGYTATPFANIFIHEGAETEEHGEDLFPRSFIYNLPIPDNYVGPVQMFGHKKENESDLPIFRTVSDHAESESLKEREGWMPPRHSKFHIPRYLGISCVPPSLKKAICSFVLSTAARKARGQDNQHNTMLVHVTRFVDVQHRIKEQIEEEFFRLRDRIRYEDGDRESILTELRAIWDDDFIQTSGEIQASDCKELSWEDVEEKLLETVSTISIREINGTSGDILEYEKRKSVGQAFNVIAIGGDKLSRGLTLEGLTVSYFLRHSKMYDTLMQMGRWFGYKPGYLDMCRIYTTDDLQNWFRNIAIAGEELRQDFNRMMICGYTPRQFGHRVCNHPQMMVTSPVKMRYTERRTMSFEGCITEPLLFPRNPKIVNENFIALQELLTKLEDDVAVGRGNARKNKDRHLWQGILPDRILAFLDRYQGHPGAIKARPEYIKKYIEKQVIRNKLKNWTIFLAPGEKEKEAITDRCEVNLVRRTWFKRPENVGENDPYRVRRVGSSDHEYIDLTKEEYENAYRMTTRMWVATAPEKRRSDYPKKPNGPGIRFARPAEQGLICFYPISAEVGLDCPKIDHPLIGFFISFPGDISADPIQYTVNEVFRRQEEEGFWDE